MSEDLLENLKMISETPLYPRAKPADLRFRDFAAAAHQLDCVPEELDAALDMLLSPPGARPRARGTEAQESL